jgi:ammonia channel protein AmtB
MKRSNYLILLCTSAAAGTAIGMFAERKQILKGGLLGAATGIVAGSVAAAAYEYVTSKEKLPYYSELSPLYDEI